MFPQGSREGHGFGSGNMDYIFKECGVKGRRGLVPGGSKVKVVFFLYPKGDLRESLGQQRKQQAAVRERENAGKKGGIHGVSLQEVSLGWRKSPFCGVERRCAPESLAHTARRKAGKLIPEDRNFAHRPAGIPEEM